MANENLTPELGGIYAEPDGCLYTWCPGAPIGCDSVGFVAFGSEHHFAPTDLEELTQIFDGKGRLLVQQLPVGGVGSPGRYSDDKRYEDMFYAIHCHLPDVDDPDCPICHDIDERPDDDE